MTLALSRRMLLGAGLASAVPLAAFAPDPAVKAALQDAVTRLGADRRTPGVSAAVIDGDTLYTAVVGKADNLRGVPMTPATRLMSGSTGKSFFAATALKLVEQGRLGLDTPLAPLFADAPWYVRLPNASALTLRMLLMHSGGFPQFLDLPAFTARYLWDSMRGQDTGYSPETMLGFIVDRPPLNAPGKAHHYSDLHYHLAGLAMERATGETVYALLQRLVLDPLALTDVIPSDRRDLPGLAAGLARGDIFSAIAGQTGNTLDDDGLLRIDPRLEWTGGGLALTPRALARFFRALAMGRIVTPSTFAAMQRSSILLPTGPDVVARYGMGLFVTDRKAFGRYVSHTGFFPGYTSNAAHFLDHGLTVAVQFNTDTGPDVNEALRSIASAVIAAKA